MLLWKNPFMNECTEIFFKGTACNILPLDVSTLQIAAKIKTAFLPFPVQMHKPSYGVCCGTNTSGHFSAAVSVGFWAAVYLSYQYVFRSVYFGGDYKTF